MFGFHHRTFKTNYQLRKDRTNMFQGNDSYLGTFSSGSTKPTKVLSPQKRHEIEKWVKEHNYIRTKRFVVLFVSVIILTSFLVYGVFVSGLLDAWLLKFIR